MSDSVVTRFAPSPTGFLHIGGARTALFNWLYARKHGGKMLLRIEDTDRERSTDAAIAAILDGLDWLGLKGDGEVVYQFSRAARHREAAESLIATDQAYYCYSTPEELTAMRELARKEGRPPRYDGRWRDASAGDVAAAQAKGMTVIGLSGFSGGGLRAAADVALHVDVANYGVVEDAHQALMHIIAQLIAAARDGTATA